EHEGLARDWMCRLNSVGSALAPLPGVTAMTDVTGFGLLGHLLEVCEGADVAAVVDFAAVPVMEPVLHYLRQGAIPGGTQRNFASYGGRIAELTEEQQQILCDPQTSGGLLVAVHPDACCEVEAVLSAAGVQPRKIGSLVPWTAGPRVKVL